MTPNSFVSVGNSKKELEKDLSSLSLGVPNDNSNPQQGSKSVSKKVLDDEEKDKDSLRDSSEKKSSMSRIDPNKKEERKLFVGGLPGNVTDEEFREFFEQYGPVLDSVVMFDRETHNSHGFGFVTFKEVSVAKAVLGGEGKTKNMITINDKKCEVKVSIPKKNMNMRSNEKKQNHREDNHDNARFGFNRGPRKVRVDDGGSMPSNPKEFLGETNHIGNGENMQLGGMNDGSNQMGASFERPPPYFVNYNFPQGNASIPAYVGPTGMMMYPTHVAPQALSPSSSQHKQFDQNVFYPPLPLVAGNGIEPVPYQAGQMNPPFIAYPVPYSQMMYPYAMPQQFDVTNDQNPIEGGIEDNRGNPVKESESKSEVNDSIA